MEQRHRREKGPEPAHDSVDSVHRRGLINYVGATLRRARTLKLIAQNCEKECDRVCGPGDTCAAPSLRTGRYGKGLTRSAAMMSTYQSNPRAKALMIRGQPSCDPLGQLEEVLIG